MATDTCTSWMQLNIMGQRAHYLFISLYTFSTVHCWLHLPQSGDFVIDEVDDSTAKHKAGEDGEQASYACNRYNIKSMCMETRELLNNKKCICIFVHCAR